MAEAASIDLDLKDVVGDLARLATRLEDPSPVMAEIAQHLELTTQRRFEKERAPDGSTWIPSRRAQVEGGRTLTKTGALLRAIRSESGRDFAAVGVGRSGGPGVYAAVHQFGATIKAKTAKGLRFSVPTAGGKRESIVVQSVTVPARPFLGLSTGDRSAVRGILQDYLEAAL
ncbi:MULTISPECIES: phage virion morphogenesis protein [Pacificimonas]|uniref:Phage virion morphogenesis protein n=1 Tax=Pacificimonas aurantium TaxID=1250540 RepID=A0ABS7WHE0_9SPHN|nr:MULTISPECIES: phage virion morphogenesis protein [Pacificimonas]MBZ6377380.1 phage virion morphogenesis protein [Pacificimonas aurantium]